MSKFGKFWKDSKKELKKVNWPDRPKVMENSLVVAICTGIFAIYLWLVDVGIYELFRLIFY